MLQYNPLVNGRPAGAFSGPAYPQGRRDAG
jgi:hypothetical protein